jgi:phosphate transport system permease protein
MTTLELRPPASALGNASGSGLRKFKDRLATTLISASFAIALVPLVWLLWTVVSKGFHALTESGWFSGTQRGITYRDSGGGAWFCCAR